MPGEGDPGTPAAAEFLRTRRNAVVATIRRDGTPQLSPVWFLWTGDRFLFSAGRRTAKAANLGRDQRMTLCIVDDEPGARYLVASGAAVPVPAEGQHAAAVALSAKYLAPDEIEAHQEHLRRTDPQLMFSCVPRRFLWREFAA